MYYNYSGVVHIHTSHSDGSSNFSGIARAALKSGAEFVLINDHDTLQGLYQEGEKYLYGVLMLVGLEVTPKCNHFLCYDVEKVPSNKTSPEEYMGKVHRQGGFGFLAHPDQRENPLFPAKMNWDNWQVDIDMPYGLEIWNFFSQWMGGFKSVTGLLKNFFFPKACLKPPEPRTLLKWDRLGEKRPVPVIAGIDAHGGRKLGWVPNVLSSYVYQFKTLRTHVITSRPLRGDVQHDRTLVLSAIKKGRSYLVNHCAGKVEKFSFYVQHSDQRWSMGEEIDYMPGMVLYINLPGKAHVRVIKNGSLYAQCTSQNLRLPNPGPGIYRVEVYKGTYWPRPWIFSNHLYLRK